MTPEDRRKLFRLVSRYGVDELAQQIANEAGAAATRHPGGRPHNVPRDVIIYYRMLHAPLMKKSKAAKDLGIRLRCSPKTIRKRYYELERAMWGRASDPADAKAADLVRRVLFYLAKQAHEKRCNRNHRPGFFGYSHNR